MVILYKLVFRTGDACHRVEAFLASFSIFLLLSTGFVKAFYLAREFRVPFGGKGLLPETLLLSSLVS